MITSTSLENTSTSLTGSKRRSYLGVGVTLFSGNVLGIIDTNLRSTGALESSLVAPLRHHYLNSYDVS